MRREKLRLQNSVIGIVDWTFLLSQRTTVSNTNFLGEKKKRLFWNWRVKNVGKRFSLVLQFVRRYHERRFFYVLLRHPLVSDTDSFLARSGRQSSSRAFNTERGTSRFANFDWIIFETFVMEKKQRKNRQNIIISITCCGAYAMRQNVYSARHFAVRSFHRGRFVVGGQTTLLHRVL